MSIGKVFENPFSELERESLSELLSEAIKLFESEHSLVEVEGDSVLVVGDTHGDVHSSVRAFSIEAEKYVFLGDYVDRGPYQLENMIFLLAKKLELPEKVYLLRGNHESPITNVHYGFLDEVVYRYGSQIYRLFVEVFSRLPYAALINGTTLAVHGGIATGLKSLSELRSLPRPDEIPENRTAFEVLWNDPSEHSQGFTPSPRGYGIFLFGRDVFEAFAEAAGIRLMLRAHEYFPEGIHEYFDGKIISLFSCRYYPETTPRGLLLTPNAQRSVVLL
ncbi:MAG: serine/threonine protein phosphatase [Thermofilaceae archaeon]